MYEIVHECSVFMSFMFWMIDILDVWNSSWMFTYKNLYWCISIISLWWLYVILLYAWNVLLVHWLVIYSRMKCVWTCYKVSKIIVVSLWCFHLYFFLSGGKSIYFLAIAHARATFWENQKHMSRNCIAFIATQEFFITLYLSFFMFVLC